MRKLLILSLFAAVAGFAQNPATAVFPGAVATDTALGVACNSSDRGTLTAGLDNQATTLTLSVSDGTKFCYPSYVTIDAEVVKVCSVAGNTVTLCSGGRAVHGNIAAHSSGATIAGYNDQNYVNQLAAELKAVESGLGVNYSNIRLVTDSVPWASLSGAPSTFAPSPHTHPLADLSTVGDYSSKITSGSYSISVTGNAGTVGTYTAAKVPNAYTHDASWTWIDNYIALPTGTSYIQWGVFTPQAAAATVTSVVCWSSTNAAVIQLRNSNGSDFITSNLTCNGTATTTLTANAAIALGQYVGMYEVSGTATWISVGIKFTTSY
jgi:hypothetical protein